VRTVNALKEVPGVVVMIVEKPCVRLSASGWSAHAKCVSEPKGIHEVAMVIVPVHNADQKEVVDPVHNAARKEDADRKVVDPVHNADQKEAVDRKVVDPVHNAARKEDADRRASEALSLEGLGGVGHVVVSFG
jgi:hypothetical protein